MAEHSFTNFLYHTAPGRFLLKGLTRPFLSKAVGAFLSCGASRILNRSFIKRNGIDLSECEKTEFRTFNECFTRKLRAEARPLAKDSEALISPCDGLLSVYPITRGLVVPVKQSWYSICALLRSESLAQEFEGGRCLVFRLQVTDYHRYVFFASGKAAEPVKISGRLHTVRPIALRDLPVFTENAREFTVIETDVFGTAVQMEVGAMMVGKIANHPLPFDESGFARVERGAEKGCFLFGGSTIIVLLKKGCAPDLAAYLEATAQDIETPVRLGMELL